MPPKLKNTAIFLAAILALALPVLADRTALRPGWNLFSASQDIEMGRALSGEADNTLLLVDDHDANTYMDALGKQLAAHAPGEKYPYQFKIADDEAIMAYALPGGFIYVSRGLIETAENEPQLAGMIAHLIGHVALRHGTQQVSNAYANEVPSSSRDRVSVRSVMSRLNIGFTPDSVVLRYSAQAERQADVVGTQILIDSGFDPLQMTRLFQSIANQPGHLTTDFFSSHPRLANRVARVRTEIANMGGLSRNPRGDSPDFHTVKERLLAGNIAPGIGADHRGAPERPSTRMVTYRGRDMEFRYPQNWRVEEETDGIYVAPDGGLVSSSLAYGMRIATFEPTTSSYFGERGLNVPSAGYGNTTLSRATDQLLDELRRSNPNMSVVRTDLGMRVDGEPSMAMELTNDSPLGGREGNWLVTVLRPNGLLYYFIGVAPQRDFNRYMTTFEQIVGSVGFTD